MKVNIACHLFITIPLYLLLSFTNVYAWGPLGHQGICGATWSISSKELKAQLANTAKRMGYQTFAESCVWADHVRKKMAYQWLSPLHYVNVPRDAKSSRQAVCKRIDFAQNRVAKPECVLAAIEYFNQRRLDDSLTTREHDEAVLLIAHFVGDLHQPLHVAYKDDRGGTRTQVVFNGKAQSLHYLWDNDILYCGFRGSWRQLGKQLVREIKSNYTTLEKTVSFPNAITQWADESLVLTRSIYANLQQRLPENYCRQYHNAAIKRLVLAGARLHYLLSDSQYQSSVISDSKNQKEVGFLEQLKAWWQLFFSLFS